MTHIRYHRLPFAGPQGPQALECSQHGSAQVETGSLPTLPLAGIALAIRMSDTISNAIGCDWNLRSSMFLASRSAPLAVI